MPCCLEEDVLHRIHSPFATRQGGPSGISAFIKGTFGKGWPNIDCCYAKEALLGCQILTGLPATIGLKLLEHNPTPKLTEMVSFCKQLLAICLFAGDVPSLLCAATTSVDSMPYSAVQELTMDVKELQLQQKAVVANLFTKSMPNHPSSQKSRGLRCFFCKEMGHIARNCPFKSHGPSTRSAGQPAGVPQTPQGRRPTMKCTLFGGQDHSPQQCANNWTLNNIPSN